MANNVTTNPGTAGAVIATDDISSVHYPRNKLSLGGEGVAEDAISVVNGLDTTATGVIAAGIVGQLDDTATGTVTENQFAPVRISSRRALLVEGVASGTVIPVSDGSGSLTVDGTVAVTQSGTWDEVGINDSGNSITVDNAQLSVVGSGTEATAMRVTIATDSTGVLSVDDNGGALTVDGTVAVTNSDLSTLAGAVKNEDVASASADPGVVIHAKRLDTPANSSGTDGDYEPLQVSGGRLWVDASGKTLTVGSHAVTNAGTFAVQVDAAIPAGTNNIGDVDVTSIAAGDNNIGNVDIVTMPNVTLAAGTNTNEIVGDIAHDTGVSGNPVQIAGAAQNNDDTAPPNRVSAESDVTRFATDLDGSLHVRTHGPQIWSYHVNGSSALTDTSVHAAPGAGLSLYVTDIIVSSGAATAMNMFLEEGSTTVFGPVYLEAIAGRGFCHRFVTPKKITANTALTITTSAAIAHSVDITGFVAQG